MADSGQTDGAEAPESKGDGDHIAKVQAALESILSKKNLVKDPMLAGHMNPQMYVPIMVLLRHDKLFALGADEASLIAAAEQSQKLGVDDDRRMIRPLLKSKRNVIILRDVPAGTTEAEVRALLEKAPHGQALVSVKPEVNNTWFVKMDLDAETQEVVLWLRSQDINGGRINAAIKSEHFLRSFFPLQMPKQQMGMGMMPEYMDPSMMGMMDPSMGGGIDPSMYSMDQMAQAPMPGPMPDGGPSMDVGGQNGGGGAGGEAWSMGPPPQPPGYWQPWGVRTTQPEAIKTSPATGPPAGRGYGDGSKSWSSWSSWSNNWSNDDNSSKGWKDKGDKGKGGKDKGKGDAKSSGKAKGKGKGKSS